MTQLYLPGKLAGYVVKYSANPWPKALRKKQNKTISPSIVGWVDVILIWYLNVSLSLGSVCGQISKLLCDISVTL